MIKNFLFLIFLFYVLPAHAQITGQVMDQKTNRPIPYVSVYFDGMYKGAISDNDGSFFLPLSGSGKIPVILSAVGYYSASITEYSSEKPLTVYLRPKVYQLKPVSIVYDGMSREEKEAIFKKEFIGTSENSLACEILNLEDIGLVYNEKTKTLEAFCDKPIRIHNKALGYKITYFLEKFTKVKEEIYFSGNYFFEEDTLTNASLQRKLERRRKQAYLGSRMHFIRALWSNKLGKEGYKVYDKDSEVEADNFIAANDSTRHVRIKDRLTVRYVDDEKQILFSYLVQEKDSVYIDKNGFYDPQGITWSGVLAKQRIGDCLPFEYQLPKNR